MFSDVQLNKGFVYVIDRVYTTHTLSYSMDISTLSNYTCGREVVEIRKQ